MLDSTLHSNSNSNSNASVCGGSECWVRCEVWGHGDWAVASSATQYIALDNYQRVTTQALQGRASWAPTPTRPGPLQLRISQNTMLTISTQSEPTPTLTPPPGHLCSLVKIYNSLLHIMNHFRPRAGWYKRPWAWTSLSCIYQLVGLV